MFTFLLILVIYFSGVAVQYVRVHTVHKEWAIRYRNNLRVLDDNILIPMAIYFSWFAFIFMFVKAFLDKRIKKYQE